ncbi:hypothetical protein EXIGLDRAFT_782188, partial [Exidia glandulosa HHB12029]
MPRWLERPADVQMRPRGSVILAFLNAADAAHAIQHSVSVFGNFCSARRFEDVPRVRTCCGTDHTGRICEREMRCGVCCSNQHTTASHKCEDISCDFYSQVHAPGTHCEHTKLKCPHCSGAHVVRDAQCKVWQSRRNALRKPQHTAAKTGGCIRRTQSRAALGTKDGRPVSGANALELGKANDAARKAAATSNCSTPPAEPAQSALFTPGSGYETERASDIYLIAEPWWRIGDEPTDPHFSVKEPAGLYPILPAQVIPAALRPRVFAYATSLRPDFEVFNRYDLAQDLDFLILEIRQGSHPPFLLVDLYNQDPPADAEGAARTFQRFKRVELPDMPIAIAMDANEHHHLWDSFTAGTSRGAEDMLEWMEEHGFSVLNDPD